MTKITDSQVFSPHGWQKLHRAEHAVSCCSGLIAALGASNSGVWRHTSGWRAGPKNLVLGLVAAMLACIAAPGQSEAEDPDATIRGSLSPTEQTQLYDEVLHVLGGNANIISRWVGDVRFASAGEASADVHAMALKTVQAVAKDARLKVVPIQHEVRSSTEYLLAVEKTAPSDLALCDRSNGESCANLVVLFSEGETMRKLADAIPLRSLYAKALDRTTDIPCFFSPFIDARMVIRQAFVYVRKDLSPEMLRTCLQEEIYQSFGLFNDVSESKFFSFNNVVEPKSITDYDRMLLRQVYDPEHKPGAPVFAVVMRMMKHLGYGHFAR